MRLACDSKNCPRRAAEKKGDRDNTSSCAAKSRCSGPMQSVMIADVRVLLLLAFVLDIGRNGMMTYLPRGGLSGFFGFSTLLAATECSLKDLFGLLVAFPARCFEKLSDW